LVEDHLPLVTALANRYARLGVDAEDLRQEGVVGLLTGLDRFDPARGVRVTTYVRWWIRAAIDDALGQRFVATLPRSVRRAARAWQQAELRGSGSLDGSADRPATFVSPAAVTPATLRCALDVMRPPVRLDQVAGERDADGVVAVEVADARASAALEAIIDDDVVLPGAPESVALLDQVVEARTRRILELRYGVDGPPQSRQEVAAQLGRTRERVRQLEAHGLAAMRAALVALTPASAASAASAPPAA
jgi:RNA polymerase sigma factor (sigma-70 family)